MAEVVQATHGAGAMESSMRAFAALLLAYGLVWGFWEVVQRFGIRVGILIAIIVLALTVWLATRGHRSPWPEKPPNATP